jgi:hypothetical protein
MRCAHDQEFYLAKPVEAIRLYIFYSRLEKYFQDTLTSELQEWNAPDAVTVRNLMWHSSARKRRRTEAGGSSCNGGIGDNDGPMGADGFDNDRLMEVMKWRNEVIEEGREARTISGARFRA